jgi:hypothetical protein
MNDAEDTGPLTPEQNLKLASSPYAGTGSLEAKEELDEMRALISNSPPDDPARRRAERNLVILEEYIDLYNRCMSYGVARVMTLEETQTICRIQRGSMNPNKPEITIINEVSYHDLALGTKASTSDVFKEFFGGTE